MFPFNEQNYKMEFESKLSCTSFAIFQHKYKLTYVFFYTRLINEDQITHTLINEGQIVCAMNTLNIKNYTEP